MGNSQIPSKTKNGAIKIECEFENCVPGKEYKGKVFLNVLLPFAFELIEVELYGVEWMTFSVYSDSKTKIKNEFLHQKIPLTLPNINGVVQPGNYVLSFVFMVGSTYLNFLPKITLRNSSGGVEYYCFATIYDPQGKPLLQNKKAFNIVNPPRYKTNYTLARNEEIYGWFSLYKGNSCILVTLGKTGITANEPLAVNIDLDCTRCSIPIKEVKCKLYERTVLSYTKILLVKMQTKFTEIQSWKFRGVDAGHKISYFESLVLPIRYNERPLQTVTGVLCNRTYYLDFIPIFDTLFLQKNIKVRFNIELCSLPLAEFMDAMPFTDLRDEIPVAVPMMPEIGLQNPSKSYPNQSIPPQVIPYDSEIQHQNLQVQENPNSQLNSEIQTCDGLLYPSLQPIPIDQIKYGDGYEPENEKPY